MVETSEPILGLQYVDEFLKETKPAECEPRYTCNLCAVTGEIVGFLEIRIYICCRKEFVKK